MDGLFTFTGIVIIIFGVLQIILFFKLWGMTDDVRKIKNKFQCSNTLLWEAKRALLKGNDELAKEKLMECMLDDLERYGYARDNFNSIEEIINKYDKPFKQLGVEIPERIKNLKTHQDIFDVIKFD